MTSRIRSTIVLSAIVTSLLVLGAAARAGDWPQFRGPDRTGISQETGLLKEWPAGGPRLAWKATGLGEGHATVSVAGGKVFGLGLRGDDEVAWAVDAGTGKGVWITKIAPKIPQIGGTQGGYGPRSAPTVDGNRVYVIGVSGDLVCLDLNGRIIWHKSLVTDFGGRVPTWGYAESPLVDGEKVIATPGGRAATLVALNKKNGETIWRAQVPEGDGAHYSSAIKAVIAGQPEYVQFLRGGVVGVAAADGKYLWRYNHPANGTANCAMPIVKGDVVFAASGYGTGGGAAKLTPDGKGGITVTELWFTKQMQNHHGGVVLVGDYLYGFDQSNLTCLDFKTGEVKWFNRSVGKGSVSVANGQIYARSERGPVALVDANPAGYMEHGRFDQPDRSGAPAWPYPAIANGKLYLRDQDVLLCYDIKAPGGQ